MTKDFLDWAVEQEEGQIISAGYDPDAKPWVPQDESHIRAATEEPRQSTAIVPSTDQPDKPTRNQPAIAAQH